MRISKPTRVCVALLASLVVSVGWPAPACWAEEPRAEGKKPDAAKPITLPKDPKAVVLSYDPGAGGFVRKGPAPYLRIQADGQVTVTNLFDGSKKETKLTAKELDELLRFVIDEKGFFTITETKISTAIREAAAKGPFIAVGGAGTSDIRVEANGKKHEVSFRAASAYLNTYPKIDVLAKFVAVEKRLAELGDKVAKGK